MVRPIIFHDYEGLDWIASENVKVEDLICMFYSGPSVCLLRDVSDSDTPLFNLVSDGYTHSLMGGEAFDLLDRGEQKNKSLLLYELPKTACISFQKINLTTDLFLYTPKVPILRNNLRQQYPVRSK
jgi:hypothetical protein